MRSGVAALVAGAVMALGGAASASPSNPAFLGIGFGPSPTGAQISTVTAESPAAHAGLLPGDDILEIDGQLVDVTTLNSYIVKHEPGDTIKLRILRHNSELLDLSPTLTTRAAMFDHLLGHTFPSIRVADSESEDQVELGKSTGHATVVAWYQHEPAGGSCIDPLPVIENISRRVTAVKTSTAHVVGATFASGPRDGKRSPVAMDRDRLGLPILVTSHEDFGNVAIEECGRVFAMVLDCNGVVTFLSPISDGDDEDATLDEIATAAAQADHKRR